MRARKNYSLESVASKVDISQDQLRKEVVNACRNAGLRVRRDKSGQVLVPFRLALYIAWKNKVFSEVECFKRFAYNDLIRKAELYRKQRVNEPLPEVPAYCLANWGDEEERKAASRRLIKNLEADFKI